MGEELGKVVEQVQPRRYERVKNEPRHAVKLGLEDEDIGYAKGFVLELTVLAKSDRLHSMPD